MAEAKVNPTTVTSYLENARELARDEQARGQSLKSRASWSLGFQGLILTLVLTVLGDLAAGTHLGPSLTPVAAAIGVIAVAILLDSARWALKALSIVDIWHVGTEETDSYPSHEFVGKETVVAEGEMLRGWVHQFHDERDANNVKARELQTAFRRLGLSFLVLAALIATVALHGFGVDGREEIHTQEPTKAGTQAPGTSALALPSSTRRADRQEP
jgi:hypothetical protein